MLGEELLEEGAKVCFPGVVCLGFEMEKVGAKEVGSHFGGAHLKEFRSIVPEDFIGDGELCEQAIEAVNALAEVGVLAWENAQKEDFGGGALFS